VVTSAGWQTAGTTLSALRSIVHALRGWPTPLGVALNTTEWPLGPGSARRADNDGRCEQLHTIGHQVVEFARVFGGPLRAGAGVSR
jgi:FMN reductase